jgi:hypothetical protein
MRFGISASVAPIVAAELGSCPFVAEASAVTELVVEIIIARRRLV